MKTTLSIFAILFTLLFFACNEVNTTQTTYDYDYGYFPIDSGAWREYSVTSINIDLPLDIFDTSNYFLREEFSSIFIDATNDTLRELHRYYKDSMHHSWTILSVWYAGSKGSEIIQVEENIKFIKQKHPLKLDKTWNGNAYNRLDTINEYNYTITQIDLPETINNIYFDSVLKVSQREYLLSDIDKYSYYEKYAYEIGLIEKEEVSITQAYVDIGIPIEERVIKGTMYYMKIINYDKAQ